MFKKLKKLLFKCQINIETIFPNEIMLKIFSNLELQDLCRCTMVSKKFNEVSRHSIFVLLKNLTGLKDISQAMKVLQAHPILMECIWKFYEFDKERQKDKQGLEDKHGLVDKHGFDPLEIIEAPIVILKDIGKSTRDIDGQFEKVELKSEFFSMQASKPKLVKLMDCLNTLPRSLKIPLHKDLSELNVCINCGLKKDFDLIGNFEILCLICKNDYFGTNDGSKMLPSEYSLPLTNANKSPLIRKWAGIKNNLIQLVQVLNELKYSYVTDE